MTEEEIAEDLEKKKAQLDKAQSSLDTKERKNRRRRSQRDKLNLLIAKSEEKVRELRNLISWHENQIKGWQKKLTGIPEDEVTSTQIVRRDKVNKEYERMKTLAWKITNNRQTLEKGVDEDLAETLLTEIKNMTREFKSCKGHGF